MTGNGFCNDEANTAGCGYDGGDCCGNCANTDLCTECTCHDEGALPLDLSCKLNIIFKIFWKVNSLLNLFMIVPNGINLIF